MTTHPTHTTLTMPTAQAAQIHADLTARVAPQGERHFRAEPTHEIDGTDYTIVSWVVRPEVAVSLADLADTYDLRITTTPTPHVALAHPPLPAPGETVEAGRIYSHDGRLVQARQTHDRTAHDPGDTPALWLRYRAAADRDEWIAAETVEAGDVRTYDGDRWRCVQAHTTQEGWTPPSTPSLWVRMVPARGDDDDDGGDTVAEWTAGEAVSVGDVRRFEGTDYECLQAHTTQAGWEPPATPALWSPL